MYPNRDAARIKDPVLRAYVYMSKGDMRQVCEQDHPEYYASDPDDLCVPVSMLRAHSGRLTIELARSKGTAELRRRAMISRVVSWEESGLFETDEDDFRISRLYTWTHNQGETVPIEIWRQLKGKKLAGGLRLWFRREEYVVIELFLGSISPQPGERIRLLPSRYKISIIHTSHIDLRS